MSDDTAPTFPTLYYRYRIAHAKFQYTGDRRVYDPDCVGATFCYIGENMAYVRGATPNPMHSPDCAYPQVVNYTWWRGHLVGRVDQTSRCPKFRFRSSEGHRLTVWLTNDPPLPPEPAGFT